MEVFKIDEVNEMKKVICFHNPDEIKGQNLLGFTLMKVRDVLL